MSTSVGNCDRGDARSALCFHRRLLPQCASDPRFALPCSALEQRIFSLSLARTASAAESKGEGAQHAGGPAAGGNACGCRATASGSACSALLPRRPSARLPLRCTAPGIAAIRTFQSMGGERGREGERQRGRGRPQRWNAPRAANVAPSYQSPRHPSRGWIFGSSNWNLTPTLLVFWDVGNSSWNLMSSQ